MKKLNFNFNVYFIGVGGAGMCVLAKALLFKGFKVSGSDIRYSNAIKELENLGLKFYLGHNEKNLQSSNLVVYSSAIKDSNCELAFARKQKMAIYSRAELLDLMLKSYKISIGVAGSHGKTTSTAMLANALKYLGVGSLSLIGGEDVNLGNMAFSNGKVAVSEVCEYNKNISKINVTYPIVLNIDNDHLDTYKCIDNLKNEFFAFLKRGKLPFLNADDVLLKEYKGKRVTYAINNNADFTACNLTSNNGKYSFTALEKGRELVNVTLNVYGKHNVYNALLVIAVLRKVFKIKPKQLKCAIESFKGVKRRFEEVNLIKGKTVIFDYCHHPTEISATIKTAKELFGDNVLFVFEPHTYSRTALLFKDFENAFKNENAVFYKTFPARERYLKSGSSKRLANCLQKPYFDKISELKKHLKNALQTNVIIMGAGELYDKLTIKKDR